MPVGRPHRHFRTVGSTNQVARELAGAGAADGTVVTSDAQSAGRGRQGRQWSTPAGAALAWSLLLRRTVEVPGTLPLQIGVAVCETVEYLGVERARLKWPNDVLIDGLKCAGVLVEARPREGWAVVGVGLNLAVDEQDFPEELRGRATSVGHRIDPRSATTALNRFVEARLAAPVDSTLAEMADRDALRGRRVSWQAGPEGSHTGVAAGIDEAGNLLVETADGTVSLNAGEVHLGGSAL
jgi:BirA family biotin operon repressor/biotin-[acetyl-CoA-carboxylase] ligase